MISSNQRWEESFKALTIRMAFASGLVIRYTIFIFSRVTVMCQIFVTVEQVGRVGSSGRLVFLLGLLGGSLGGGAIAGGVGGRRFWGVGWVLCVRILHLSHTGGIAVFG